MIKRIMLFLFIFLLPFTLVFAKSNKNKHLVTPEPISLTLFILGGSGLLLKARSKNNV